MTGSRKGTIRKMISIGDSFAIMKLIEAEYASSQMTDEAFAAYVREKLNLPTLNKDHIRSRRNELGIEQNYPRYAAGSGKKHILELITRVEALEILAKRFALYMGDAPIKAVK